MRRWREGLRQDRVLADQIVGNTRVVAHNFCSVIRGAFRVRSSGGRVMKMTERRMRAAINEFQRDVLSRDGEEAVVPHAQGVFRAVASRVPGVDSGERASIGSNDGW